MRVSRRELLALGACGIGSMSLGLHAETGRPEKTADLGRKLGITTSSFDAHCSATGADGKISLFDLPKIVRDELDMQVIDINTKTLGLEPANAERFRAAADRAGCIVTNLKLNQNELDLGSSDAEVRRRTMSIYRQWVDAAAILGARWVRPIPSREPPHMQNLIAGYRELAEYTRPKQIGLLVENFRWMETDPKAAARLVREIGSDVRASTDIGNWASNDVRYDGLIEFFPLAVTCDFKAGKLERDGTHPAYDLRRCFQIGWDSGFRGPWCFEHVNPDRAELLRELALLRDMLGTWMKEQRDS